MYTLIKKLYLKIIYRPIGFSILWGSLLAGGGYGIIMMYFLFSHTWLAPTVLTVTSDRMLQFTQGYQAASQNMDTLNVTLHQAERDYVYSKQNVQLLELTKIDLDRFLNTTGSLSLEKSKQLATSYKLAKELDVLKQQVARSRAAGLVTNLEVVQSNTQVQEFENGLTDSSQAQASLFISTDSQLVQLDEQLRQAKNDVETKLETVEAATHSVTVAHAGMQFLMDSAYYQAYKGRGGNLAFVSYDNRKIAYVGAPIYDCYAMIVFCHQVGLVKRVYNDEQVIDFPMFNMRLSRTVRGFLVDMEITNPKAMDSTILFVGKPFGI